MLERERVIVKEAVRRAGEAILRIADEHYQEAVAQADRTVLTEADLAADRILREALTSEFPDDGWLSEETKDNDRRLNCARVWIVDPMDGTREFVMKTPEYVVSVALVEQGQGILGVIYNPVTSELFEAVKGQGVKLNGEPVAPNPMLKARPRVEVSRSDIEKGKFADYESKCDLCPCGSIAYKLARLAVGQSDSTLSVTPKNEWDIAAGVVLVTEAGGMVTDLDGAAYTFNQPDTLVNGVIAANRSTYPVIRDLVDRVSNSTS